ncbi:MAG: hypothetical protein KDE54_37600 [Caldilineaceae bacterium]|nr:hypothetical protein [Caldilineaceae bacterium]MCB0096158.1 hypothetical protein [Caldilineaceae bacterium]MCB0142425.1 hypothetical protein [Caldilineaceae bacterium]MCB9147394.1 hypothetical protein [Caldilineaceae bacterium]
MYDLATICFMQVAARNMRENLRRELNGINIELPKSQPTRMAQLREKCSAQLIVWGQRLQAQNGAGRQPTLRTVAK